MLCRPRVESFRWLWVATLFSSLGQWMQQVISGWVVYDLTGSGTLLGGVNGVRSIAMLGIGPFAGAERLGAEPEGATARRQARLLLTRHQGGASLRRDSAAPRSLAAAEHATGGNMSYTGMTTETIQIKGHGGDAIDAYVAKPAGDGPFPSVIVVHHMPGWDEWSIEVTRRLAHHGYAAICPNLHQRVPGPLEGIMQRVRDAGGSPDDVTLGDLQASLDYLRSASYTTGKVGLIGFCSGGRIAYMAACNMDIDASVDCWGGNVVAPADRLTPQQPTPVIDMTPDMRCPLMGLFGNDDQNPDTEQVNQTEAELKKHKKEYEFHRYDGAGHGFFGWERPGYRQEQAVDGWQKVFAFYEKHLR